MISTERVRELVSRVPTGAEIVVPSEAAAMVDGRVVHPISIERSLRMRGADPDRGRGALDQLALRRARGATHLMLPARSWWWLVRYPELKAFVTQHCQVVAREGLDVVWSLPAPPPPGPPKVFCIGLMKTATSSLHHALTDLGLHSLHWGGSASFHGVLAAQRRGDRLLADVGEHYDAYSDIGPLSARFDLLELQYPGSKFILTVRDVDQWVASRRKHIERNRRDREGGTYAGVNLELDEQRWRDEWRMHVDRITSHFTGRSNFLLLDLCANPRWDELVAFLGCGRPDTAFPSDQVHRTTNVDVPLHLARRSNGSLVLVEGDRVTDVGTARLGPSLRRVLGSPTTFLGEPSGESAAVVAHGGLSGLVDALPPRSQPIVPAELAPELMDCGRVVHSIALDWSVRGHGADPDRGRGALDQVALCRARGATHLLLAESSAWWLARYPQLADHLAHQGRVVAANESGVAWELPPAEEPGPPKVFCIGLRKTGAHLLHRALLTLGLESLRGGGSANFQGVLRAQSDCARLLRDIGEQYDAYLDITTLSSRFDLLDLQYPGSKFILTVRDVDGWIAALRSRAPADFDERRWKDEWQAHVDRVTAHFAGRDDLLVVDVFANPRWDELAAFLDRPAPSRRFPRENRRRRTRSFNFGSLWPL